MARYGIADFEHDQPSFLSIWSWLAVYCNVLRVKECGHGLHIYMISCGLCCDTAIRIGNPVPFEVSHSFM